MRKLYIAYQICSVEGVCHGLYVLWMLRHGLDPVTVALILSLGEATLLVTEIPTGWWADRFGLKRSLILGSLLQLLGMGAFWAGFFWASTVLVALGDAFRHGADEAILYRADPSRFQSDLARAQSLTTLAMLAFTLLGGWLATNVSYDAAWALELALCSLGLILALHFPDHPGLEEDSSQARFRHWGAILPTTLIFGLAAAGEFCLQAASASPEESTLRISAVLLLESLGAWLASRYPLPLRTLPLLAILGVVMGGKALALLYLAAGMAPSLRSQLIQDLAGERERAQLLSAASSVDMLVRMLVLPLAGRYLV
ncbi:MFS transporter [bacterium]|nr:MFS transporter [bacterium]